MMRPTRFVILSFLVTLTLWLCFRSKRQVTDPEAILPAYEVWGIDNLNAQVRLSTVVIHSQIRRRFEQPIKQDIDLQFDFTDVDLTLPLPELSVTEVRINVPETKKADGSEILFGMATKLDRLRDALPAISQWATGTNVHIVAVVEPQVDTGPTKDEVVELYQKQNITLTPIEVDLDWWSQYVALAGVLHDHAVSQTKWVCLMDDDTYFFSMKRLSSMLNKYDPTRPYYVGGISENMEHWGRIGYFAYGGAGVFLSMPLLKELRPRIDECVSLPDQSGDIRLNTCIMNFTTTKFTWDHKLFQMDIHGDLSGFYEAPRERPLNTHHWNSWHHNDMVRVGTVAAACGNECVLQKYITADGWMVTNGFSVIKHSYDQQELSQQVPGAMEHTWDHTAWVIPDSWKYTLYPLKPRDSGKIQFLIEKAVETDSDVTLYYVHRERGRGKGIIKMIWNK